MFGFGSSPSRKCCGAQSQPETTYFPTVPTCPGTIPFNAAGCISNKGKFYDQILHDLLLPISGQEVKAYVCEPGLWSSCQWAAICYGDNKIAILKVVGLGADYILLVNACQDGQPIEDNPPPGSKLAAQSTIYPVPPPWCSQAFCEKINAALEDPDCACQGVQSCLQNSEEICFSNVPTIEEGEELHLFGGTMLTQEGNENDNPSLWKSCVKKLKEIFTGYTGKSICFADLPETTGDPDIIEGVPVPKRQVLLDGFGCLRSGPLAGESCDADLGIVPGEDRFHSGIETPGTNNPNTNSKSKVFEFFSVCFDGVKRILSPTASCNTIISRISDDNTTKYWEETPMFGRIMIFDTSMVLNVGSATLNLKDYAKYKRAAGDCNLYAIISLTAYADGSSGANGGRSYTANGMLVGAATVVGATRANFTQNNIIVKLTENSLLVTYTSSGSGINHYSIAGRLRGYMIGGKEI